MGTPEDKGRCSSHPPRNLKSAKNTPSPSPRSSEEPRAQVTPTRPSDPAWTGGFAVLEDEASHLLRVVALHTPLNNVSRIDRGNEDGRINLSLPTYAPVDVRPQFREESFTLRSQCLLHLYDSAGKGSSSTVPIAESVLLFLFEHNTSLGSSTLPSWQGSWSRGNDKIQEMGPGALTNFPAHHFFTRVYRPGAIATAILNRRPIFCSNQEWLSVPWQRYPKSPFDELLDIMLQIPSLLQRLDHAALGLGPSSSLSFDCRPLAQSLLEACLLVQGQLDQWYASLHQAEYYRSQATYWLSLDQQETTAEFPFTNVLAFRDGHTALLFLYYWAAQVSLYPCIELLGHTIASLSDQFLPINEKPVASASSYSSLHHYGHQQQQLYPDESIPPPSSPSHLQTIDYSFLYGPNKVREIAANICHALDFALQTTTQPDLLAFPTQIVEVFYRGLNVAFATMGSPSSSSSFTMDVGISDHTNETALELMWLGRFRARMAMRGQRIAGMVVERGWVDLAEW